MDIEMNVSVNEGSARSVCETKPIVENDKADAMSDDFEFEE